MLGQQGRCRPVKQQRVRRGVQLVVGTHWPEPVRMQRLSCSWRAQTPSAHACTCTTTMLPTAAAAWAARGDGGSPSGVTFDHVPVRMSKMCTSLVAPARRIPALWQGGTIGCCAVQQPTACAHY